MKRNVLLCMILVLWIFPFDVFGWSSAASDPGREHGELSEHLFYVQPYLWPYVDCFDEWSVDESSIIYWSNIETPPGFDDQWKWKNIDTLNELYQLPISNYNLGAILHAAEDSGVPANHIPGGNYWPDEEGGAGGLEDLAHDSIEHTAKYKMSGSNYLYYKNNPPLTHSDLLTGNWFNKRDTYMDAMESLTGAYRTWFLDPQGNNGGDTHNVPATYVESALLQSLRWSHAAFTHFMDYYEVTEPGSTIAHWGFDENTGQITVNSKGSNVTHLWLGTSPSTTDYDPTWSNGSIRCIDSDYVENTSEWTEHEWSSITPNSSYTIEAVFKPTTLVNGSATSYGGVLACYGSLNNGDVIQYAVKVYKKLISGSRRSVVEFYSIDPNHSSHTITLNTYAAGMEMAVNKWYYFAAIFHYKTSIMELVLCDTATGQTISTSGVMNELHGLDNDMTPHFYIGRGHGGCYFKGYIDDVRISNRALTMDADRLYNSTLAHWRFDESLGQVAYSNMGFEANLQLGSSSSPDSHDLSWSTGYWGGALHGEGYVQNSNIATYALADPDNGSGWPLATANALVPSSSYSIEAIFNLEEYPVSGTTTMGIVDYSDYVDGSIRYRIITYLSGSNTCIQYQSGSTVVTWDTNSAGMPIIPGNWYYIAAFFNDDTDKVDLVLRDLQSISGMSITKPNNTMQPMTIYSSSSRPVFFVGTDTFNSKSFDGKIDEVRVSNSYLTEKDRLYMHGSTIAHWKFDYDYATAGQTIDNVDNDLLLPLQLGQSRERPEDGDTHEPVLELQIGWYAGSIHLGEQGAVTYVLADPDNGSGWSLTEANAAAPTDSYSVEAIFNADVYSSEMGIVYYSDYNNSNTKYRITTYRSAAGNTYIRFASGSTTVNWNTKAAGLEIVTGKWYYIGVFFDSVTDKVYFTLYDLQGNTWKTSEGDTVPHATAFTTSSRPVFFVGADYFNGRVFDGYIDEVRISSQFLPTDCRLYNLPR